MSIITRRRLLAGAGTAAVGLAVARSVGTADAAEDAIVARQVPPGPVSIGPTDPRYPDLLLRGYNKRFVGKPESVRIVGRTEHVVQAVNEAVQAGKRIAVRSGGHGLDGLVDDPEIKVVIDFTEMRSVTWDSGRKAFAIEPGAALANIYRTLYYGWGVTIPGGVCPAVGAGGHIIGGGVGALSRQYGLVADLLYAVEVVVVGTNGAAKAVVATREASDPNRDLWWVHTGGGGGNFGVVTKFWLRTEGAASRPPSAMLPKAPGAVMVGRAIWNWPDMTSDSFTRICRNFGVWHEQNSAPGAAGNQIYASLIAPRKEAGKILVSGQIDPTVPGTEQRLTDFLAAVSAGVTPAPLLVRTPRQPWLNTTINVPDTAVSVGVLGPPRSKTKGGYLKRRYSDAQIAKVYHHLTRADYTHKSSSFTLASYGGQINALTPYATASVHRDSVMLGSVFSCWDVPSEDAVHLAWNREFYRDLYADTGGVPVPNDVNDGCYINWPDTDLAGNSTSNVPWSTLYYKGNYRRLQQVKAKWDPTDTFRHTLSIKPA